jgi:hypothetical protein
VRGGDGGGGGGKSGGLLSSTHSINSISIEAQGFHDTNMNMKTNHQNRFQENRKEMGLWGTSRIRVVQEILHELDYDEI